MSLTTSRAIWAISSRFDHRLVAVLVEQRRLAAAFAGDDDLVGGAQRLAAEPGVHLAVVGDAELDVVFEEGVEHGVGNLVADLVRMAFGNGFAGEQIIGVRHREHSSRGAASLPRRFTSVCFLQCP